MPGKLLSRQLNLPERIAASVNASMKKERVMRVFEETRVES